MEKTFCTTDERWLVIEAAEAVDCSRCEEAPAVADLYDEECPLGTAESICAGCLETQIDEWVREEAIGPFDVANMLELIQPVTSDGRRGRDRFFAGA